jgi:RNA polymerase sigma-70 factor, ECF subfamily
LALSQAEFDRMVADHGPALYRTAFRMVGDRHEAEDIVQDTFRSTWKSRGLFRPGLGERAWLVSILRRRVADRWRRRRLPTVLQPDLSGDVAVDGDNPLAGEYSDEMQQALARLDPKIRETLLLVVVGELTHQEAANELGVPIGTVLSRVARAREQLRAHLLTEQRK